VLREIYGIEQKEEETKDDDDDNDEALDETRECVVCTWVISRGPVTVLKVCMSESRDTIVLPCRHLCLCNPCAEVLRFQVSFFLAFRPPLSYQPGKQVPDLQSQLPLTAPASGCTKVLRACRTRGACMASNRTYLTPDGLVGPGSSPRLPSCCPGRGSASKAGATPPSKPSKGDRDRCR
jgi:hypothetical protein